MSELPLDQKSREYLSRFCEERNQGRSGMVQWDQFLVQAYKGGKNPAPADLYDWLQKRLHDAGDIEQLIHDYQRVGAMFGVWDRTVVPHHEPAVQRADDLLSRLTQLDGAQGILLGDCVPGEGAQGTPKSCMLDDEYRDAHPHVLIVGRRDMGKTELMWRMMRHDIERNDRAVVAIDMDGDLCDRLASWTKGDGKAHMARVITLDPMDAENSVKFNPLKFSGDVDLRTAASAVVDAFAANAYEPDTRFAWNRRAEDILLDAVMLLMVNSAPLTDLPTMLQEVDFRDVLLEKAVKEKGERPEIDQLLATWQQYKRVARSDQWIDWIYPINARLTGLLSSQRLRAVLAHGRESCLDLTKAVQEKKVVVVRLPQSHFKKDASLLASLVIYQLERVSTRSVSLFVEGITEVLDRRSVEALAHTYERHQVNLTASAPRLVAPPWTASEGSSWGRTLSSFGNIAVFAADQEDAHVLSRKMPSDASAFFARHGWNIDENRLMAERLVLLSPRHYVWWHTTGAGATVEITLPSDKPAAKSKAK